MVGKRDQLRLTPKQKDKIFAARVGYGIASYKSEERTITEFEFFLDRQNRMCYIASGKPVEFEVHRDSDGDERFVNLTDTEEQLRVARARIEILEKQLKGVRKEVYFASKIIDGEAKDKAIGDALLIIDMFEYDQNGSEMESHR
jgi:hypothetical protein